MPRDNRCMYMAHVCFYICCSMLCVCVVDVMDVVFSVCIVRRGAVGACVWEV